MDGVIVLIILGSLFLLAIVGSIINDLFGGAVKDYHCTHCTKGPKTFIPAQNKVPICTRCGYAMEEYKGE